MKHLIICLISTVFFSYNNAFATNISDSSYILSANIKPASRKPRELTPILVNTNITVKEKETKILLDQNFSEEIAKKTKKDRIKNISIMHLSSEFGNNDDIFNPVIAFKSKEKSKIGDVTFSSVTEEAEDLEIEDEEFNNLENNITQSKSQKLASEISKYDINTLNIDGFLQSILNSLNIMYNFDSAMQLNSNCNVLNTTEPIDSYNTTINNAAALFFIEYIDINNTENIRNIIEQNIKMNIAFKKRMNIKNINTLFNRLSSKLFSLIDMIGDEIIAAKNKSATIMMAKIVISSIINNVNLFIKHNKKLEEKEKDSSLKKYNTDIADIKKIYDSIDRRILSNPETEESIFSSISNKCANIIENLIEEKSTEYNLQCHQELLQKKQHFDKTLKKNKKYSKYDRYCRTIQTTYEQAVGKNSLCSILKYITTNITYDVAVYENKMFFVQYDRNSRRISNTFNIKLASMLIDTTLDALSKGYYAPLTFFQSSKINKINVNLGGIIFDQLSKSESDITVAINNLTKNISSSNITKNIFNTSKILEDVAQSIGLDNQQINANFFKSSVVIKGSKYIDIMSYVNHCIISNIIKSKMINHINDNQMMFLETKNIDLLEGCLEKSKKEGIFDAIEKMLTENTSMHKILHAMNVLKERLPDIYGLYSQLFKTAYSKIMNVNEELNIYDFIKSILSNMTNIKNNADSEDGIVYLHGRYLVEIEKDVF